ncbi:MAG: RDD family protein [Bacteroidota bacterium]
MENTNFEFAGFWKRFAATIIDGVLVIYFTSALKWVIADVLRIQPDLNFDFEESQNIAYYIWSVYLVLIRWCYFAGMESSPLQATLGKLAVGIYVTDRRGSRIGFGTASGRFFGKLLSSLIVGIGYLMAGFTEKKQALHDQMSDCMVVSK